MCQARLPPSHDAIQEVEGETHGVLQRLHKAEDVVFRRDVHYLAGLKTGVGEEVRQRGRGEVKQMARNIEVKPPGFADSGFERPEVWYSDHQHSTWTQQAPDVVQCPRWIVHVLDNVPKHYSVIADALGNQLVKILRPNIEIQHLTGMLCGTG
jgi:hypothetical protein